MENGQESESREQGESVTTSERRQAARKEKGKEGKGKEEEEKEREEGGGKEGGKKGGRKERWKVRARTWRWEPLCTARGNVKWCGHCEQQQRGASKPNTKLPCEPTIPF